MEHLDEVGESSHIYFDKIQASGIVYKETRVLGDIYTKGSKIDFEKNVKYLNEVERKEYEIFVQHDKIVDKNGKLFDTNGSIEIDIDKRPINSNKSIYVMSEKGEIYVSKNNQYGKFHHSSFLSGQKVSAAGDVIIEKGIIKEIS